MGKFYNFRKKMENIKDLNGEKPDIIFINSNRSDGKTTSVSCFLYEEYINNGSQFVILKRYDNRLKRIAEKFQNDISDFYECELKENIIQKDKIIEIINEDKPMGFAVSLNGYEVVKDYSKVFKNVNYIFFDEFQSEKNNYLQNETYAFFNIYSSIARGFNNPSRKVQCILTSNIISMLNPYYLELGISERMMDDTKILKGNGWVVDRHYNKWVGKQHEKSSFKNAFSNYKTNLTSEKALKDSSTFVTKLKGLNEYLCGFKFNNEFYSLITDSYLYLIKPKCDKNLHVYSCTIYDHTEVTEFINKQIVWQLKEIYSKGLLRFYNQKSKSFFFNLMQLSLL